MIIVIFESEDADLTTISFKLDTRDYKTLVDRKDLEVAREWCGKDRNDWDARTNLPSSSSCCWNRMVFLWKSTPLKKRESFI